MSDAQVFRLRVTFCKQGRLAMLSHLEIARALERAVRRAGLPFAISQGFSPHMKIAFGAALPVGVGGLHEVFDLQLTRYVAPERARDDLQAASAPDLMVKDCVYVESKAPAASVALPISTYRALLSCAPSNLSIPGEITVIRKKKEKVLQVSEFIVGDIELAGAVITFSLEAKPTGSLRPDVLLRACVDGYNVAEGLTEGAADVSLPSVAVLKEETAGKTTDAMIAGTEEVASALVGELEKDTLIPAQSIIVNNMLESAGDDASQKKPCTFETPLRVVSITRIDQHA